MQKNIAKYSEKNCRKVQKSVKKYKTVWKGRDIKKCRKVWKVQNSTERERYKKVWKSAEKCRSSFSKVFCTFSHFPALFHTFLHFLTLFLHFSTLFFTILCYTFLHFLLSEGSELSGLYIHRCSKVMHLPNLEQTIEFCEPH